MGRGMLLAALVFSSQALAEGAAPCPHPYFPMSNGLSFLYKAGKAQVKVRFSDVTSDGVKQRGVLHLENKGKQGTTEATCDVNGIQTQLGGIEGAALNMSGMDVKVVSSEGIAMLPPDKMVEGATWSNALALELRPPAGSKLPFGVVKTTFKKDSIVEGKERIEVAGKMWDALRIKNKVTAMAGTAGERSMETMMWLAPGVGILRIKTGNVVDFELLEVMEPEASPRAEAHKPAAK